MSEFDNIGMVTYDEEAIASLDEISQKIPEVQEPIPEPEIDPETGEEIPVPEPEPSSYLSEEVNLFDNYHNFYINFFNYLKQFLKYTVVGGFDSRYNTKKLLRIKEFSFSYGSKTMSTTNVQGDETFEFPVCNIVVNDMRPVDSVRQISRQTKNNSFASPQENVFIAENEDKKEVLMTALAQNLLSVSASIEFEDSTDIVNYSNMLFNTVPLNFTVYTPKYSNYINVTDMVSNWEKTDDYNGLLIKPSNTYLNKDYVFAEIVTTPTVELSAASQMVDKTSMNYTLNLEMIWHLQQPIGVTKNRFYTFEKIEVDINTSTNAGLIDNNLPILTTTSIDSDILNDSDIVAKPVRSYIQLESQNFAFQEDDTTADNAVSLTFYLDVDLLEHEFSFWSKVINTVVSSSERPEYYYPLDYLKLKEETVEIIDINKDLIDLDGNALELTDDQILARINEVVLSTAGDALKQNILVKINIYKNSVLTKYCYIIKSHYLTADAGNLDNYNSKLLLF